MAERAQAAAPVAQELVRARVVLAVTLAVPAAELAQVELTAEELRELRLALARVLVTAVRRALPAVRQVTVLRAA